MNSVGFCSGKSCSMCFRCCQKRLPPDKAEDFLFVRVAAVHTDTLKNDIAAPFLPTLPSVFWNTLQNCHPLMSTFSVHAHDKEMALHITWGLLALPFFFFSHIAISKLVFQAECCDPNCFTLWGNSQTCAKVAADMTATWTYSSPIVLTKDLLMKPSSAMFLSADYSF